MMRTLYNKFKLKRKERSKSAKKGVYALESILVGTLILVTALVITTQLLGTVRQGDANAVTHIETTIDNTDAPA